MNWYPVLPTPSALVAEALQHPQAGFCLSLLKIAKMMMKRRKRRKKVRPLWKESRILWNQSHTWMEWASPLMRMVKTAPFASTHLGIRLLGLLRAAPITSAWTASWSGLRWAVLSVMSCGLLMCSALSPLIILLCCNENKTVEYSYLLS